jgi:hypothetical protein
VAESTEPTPASPRDWWVSFGLAVSAAAALVSSFSGLRALALAAGWSAYLAPLLPLTVDSYAMTAARVWLADSSARPAAKRFARANSFVAIGMSVLGNAAWHLIAAHLLAVGWVIVVVVGAVPPAVLGLVAHLAALRTQPARSAVPAPVPVPPDRTQVSSDEALLMTARAADTAWRAAHDGRGITRDELRKTLHVGAARAGRLLRRLRAEPNQPTTDHKETPTA